MCNQTQSPSSDHMIRTAEGALAAWRKWKGGDSLAYDNLANYLRSSTWSLVSQITQPQGKYAQLAADTLVSTIQESLRRFNPESVKHPGNPLLQWHVHVSRHRFINELRKENAQVRGGGFTKLSLDNPDDVPVIDGDCTQAYMREKYLTDSGYELEAAKRRLPESYREILSAIFDHNLSISDLSELGTFGRNRSVVAGLRQKALERLKKELKAIREYLRPFHL